MYLFIGCEVVYNKFLIFLVIYFMTTSLYSVECYKDEWMTERDGI
jgi:hypothetical protein